MTNKVSGFSGFARLDSTGAWTSVSDQRLKTDVKPAKGNLEAALRLRPVTYKWRSDGADGSSHLGLIAQELRDVLPDMVAGDESRGMLTANYSGLSVVAIGAIQELNARLKAEVTKKDAEIAALTARLERLEAPRRAVSGVQRDPDGKN